MRKQTELGTQKPITWTPQDYIALLVASTGCLSLLILVLGIVLGILGGMIPVDQVGTIKSAGIGGGLIGLAAIIYQVINVALRGNRKP
jgi:hypothetical protein